MCSGYEWVAEWIKANKQKKKPSWPLVDVGGCSQTSYKATRTVILLTLHVLCVYVCVCVCVTSLVGISAFEAERDGCLFWLCCFSQQAENPAFLCRLSWLTFFACNVPTCDQNNSYSINHTCPPWFSSLNSILGSNVVFLCVCVCVCVCVCPVLHIINHKVYCPSLSRTMKKVVALAIVNSMLRHNWGNTNLEPQPYVMVFITGSTHEDLNSSHKKSLTENNSLKSLVQELDLDNKTRTIQNNHLTLWRLNQMYDAYITNSICNASTTPSLFQNMFLHFQYTSRGTGLSLSQKAHYISLITLFKQWCFWATWKPPWPLKRPN